MQNNTLVIVGMHRSGTSLITNWLGRCGLEIGDNLLGPGIGNVDGHFEDTEFHDAHVDILTGLGLHHSGIITEDVKDMITTEHLRKLRKIVSGKNKKHHQWAWKDPRTCIFLDAYHELLPFARYLVVLRDYRSVVISLLKRSFAEVEEGRKALNKSYLSDLFWRKIKRKREFEKLCSQKASFYLDVWIHYNENILKFLRHLPAEYYLVINYLMLKQNDRVVFDHLTEEWGFGMKYSAFSEIYNEKLFSGAFDIDQYLSEKQRTQADEIMRRLTKRSRQEDTYRQTVHQH